MQDHPTGLGLAGRLADEIRTLAGRALAHGLGAAAAHEARARVRRPVDYMRHAEFEAVLRWLDLHDGMRVVDFSGPQWLTLALAARHPGVSFVYTNIIDAELAVYREIAQALALPNLVLREADMRALDLPNGRVDRALCVSVLEHVYPEVGGDAQALAELHRVLAPGGALLLTVPFKAVRHVQRVDAAVYERAAASDTFYAREYDRAQLDALLAGSPLALAAQAHIHELDGPLALDAIGWGPRRGRLLSRLALKLVGSVERMARVDPERQLAQRHLRLSAVPQPRLVNIGLRLERR